MRCIFKGFLKIYEKLIYSSINSAAVPQFINSTDSIELPIEDYSNFRKESTGTFIPDAVSSNNFR